MSERLTKVMDDPSYGGCGGVILAKCENCTTRLSSCYEEDCGKQNEANQKLEIIENMLYDADGNEVISLDRLRELTDAERDGCVVALPFKIGDKAYWITHFGKMKASGIVVDILIRARDVLVGIDTENGSGTRKSIKDILYFQEAEAARALSEKG